ncbi:MAG: translation initiation factor IF-2 [Acidobacteria bacterium]|nr:translation initiation factor IF-2 [Acidobacteriota bacterium]
MKKIRINELARECEQPNSAILALLAEFGVTEKKTHSSSVDEDVADQVRRHLGILVEEAAPEQPEAVGEATVPADGRTLPAAPVVPAGLAEAPGSAAAAAPWKAPRTGPELASVIRAAEVLAARPAAQPIRPPLVGRTPALGPLGAAPAVVEPAPAPPPPPPPPPALKPGQIIEAPRPAPGTAEGLRLARPTPAPARPAAAAPAPAQPQRPPTVIVTGKPALAGRPAARPVVPPRPDLVAKLTQARAMPGQPQARPAMPGRPAAPIPGQPIYKGPLRPGQPLVARGRPGAPVALGLRGRGPHPTSPLQPHGVLPPPGEPARRSQRDRARAVTREVEQEEKLLRLRRAQREDISRLAEGKQVTVSEGITVKELGEKLGLKANLVIKRLVERKIYATINQTLDLAVAENLARDFGAQPSQVSYEEEAAIQVAEGQPEEGDQVRRAPVVTIMGHVDHGKTSLLDAIRLSNTTEREAGGITQHIGAYAVRVDGRRIVFIDTPGHEAFTRMRARGAKVTDIVILVVAADDGVMPQTKEAIDHARAAKAPILVAINKIDKAEAQIDRVKQQLADHGLLPEEWGGETVTVPVSARTRQNLELLLEMILLVADMLDLKASPQRPAVATVLEAKLDRGRGPVATVLVRNGTLHVGDYFISGSVFGKVRAMFDDLGQPLREAEPATPVEVLGLEALPDVGENLQVVTDTAKAKQIVIYRESKAREQAMAKSSRLTLDQLHQQIRAGETKELPVILKADVGGSAEVLAEALQKLSSEKIKVQVIHSGVGAITETDVLLASASNAVVVGFNVRPERNAAALAEQEKVDIRLHTVIYELTDEIKRAMAGLLEPVYKEVYLGRAEVRETFRVSKVGTVAGCLVSEGHIARDAQVRVLRDSVVVYTGRIGSLKRFKDDASEVRNGLECGLGIENFNDVKPGDVIEAFTTKRIEAEVLV